MSLRIGCGTAGTAFGQWEYGQLKLTKKKKSAIKLFVQWSRSNAHRRIGFCDQHGVASLSPLKIFLLCRTFLFYFCPIIILNDWLNSLTVAHTKLPNIFSYLVIKERDTASYGVRGRPSLESRSRGPLRISAYPNVMPHHTSYWLCNKFMTACIYPLSTNSIYHHLHLSLPRHSYAAIKCFWNCHNHHFWIETFRIKKYDWVFKATWYYAMLL